MPFFQFRDFSDKPTCVSHRFIGMAGAFQDFLYLLPAEGIPFIRILPRPCADRAGNPHTGDIGISQDGLMNALSKMKAELSADETDLLTLTDSTLDKLSAMIDEDYDKLELYPDFDE